MTLSVIILSAVTKQVDYLPSRNPCDRNFISAGHTYISEPAYRLVDHCHERVPSNETHYLRRNNTGSSNFVPNKVLNTTPVSATNQSPSNYSHVFSITRHSTIADNRRLSDSNETLPMNCTKHHRHLTIHQIHRYPPSVKYICLLALMTFVAGYAIGYGPSKFPPSQKSCFSFNLSAFHSIFYYLHCILVIITEYIDLYSGMAHSNWDIPCWYKRQSSGHRNSIQLGNKHFYIDDFSWYNRWVSIFADHIS